jgi:hypothetical protein
MLRYQQALLRSRGGDGLAYRVVPIELGILLRRPLDRARENAPDPAGSDACGEGALSHEAQFYIAVDRKGASAHRLAERPVRQPPVRAAYSDGIHTEVELRLSRPKGEKPGVDDGWRRHAPPEIEHRLKEVGTKWCSRWRWTRSAGLSSCW